MGGVMNRVDVGETGKVYEEGPQHSSADSGYDALALGGWRSNCMGATGTDGHGACLS
jgi:hypothetical protein